MFWLGNKKSKTIMHSFLLASSYFILILSLTLLQLNESNVIMHGIVALCFMQPACLVKVVSAGTISPLAHRNEVPSIIERLIFDGIKNNNNRSHYLVLNAKKRKDNYSYFV